MKRQLIVTFDLTEYYDGNPPPPDQKPPPKEETITEFLGSDAAEGWFNCYHSQHWSYHAKAVKVKIINEKDIPDKQSPIVVSPRCLLCGHEFALDEPRVWLDDVNGICISCADDQFDLGNKTPKLLAKYEEWKRIHAGDATTKANPAF